MRFCSSRRTLQVTGSFKIRGAYNKIASLSEEQIARGIVTASAGNHAQGVAYAARERHAKATICMPQITPPLKVDATKAYGADVVLYGDVFRTRRPPMPPNWPPRKA